MASAGTAEPLPPSTARSSTSRRGGGPRFARGTAASEHRSHGLDPNESAAAAFRPNSYTCLRPAALTSRVVDKGPFRLRTTSREASARGGGGGGGGGGGARHELEPFGTLAYIPSPYNAVRMERLREMEANRAAIEKVHGAKSTFTVRSPTRGGASRAPGGASPARSLSPPDASAVVLSAAPPQLSASSVADEYGTLEVVRRQQELESLQKRVAGPFRPTAAADKALNQPTRLRLREIMLSLCQAVISDLRASGSASGTDSAAKDSGNDVGISTLRPTVLATQEGLLAIRFPCDASPELHKAMNRMLVHNQVIRDEHLTKLQGSWGVPADAGGTMYLLRPPWVRPPSRLPQLTGGSHQRSLRS